MKKLYILLGLLISSLTFAQVPLLIEDFDYTENDLLTDHGWSGHSGGTTNAQLVTSPGLTFDGYVGSGVGLAAGVNNTGQDVNKLYSVPASGSVYASFLLNSASMGPGGYFFHFRDEAATTAFRARTHLSDYTGKMRVGFSFNASTYVDSLSTLLNFGETYLFVVKYTIVDGVDNDIVSLYVFKAGDDFSTEPATPSVGPLTATNTTPGDPGTPLGPDISPMEVAFRQFNADQRITIDGLRVKTNWDLTADEVANMSVSTNEVSIAGADNSTNTVDITANVDWKAASDQTWLTLSADSGTSSTTLTLTAAENASALSRTATVTVTAGVLTPQTITVTQEGLFSLSVSTNAVSVAAAASSTGTFDITTNTDWTAVSDQTWLTLSSGSGNGNTTITVTAEENTTLSTRAATVTVTVTDITPEAITVTQDAGSTGIKSFSYSSFDVYPNPVTNGLLNLSVSGNSVKHIEIYNEIGKLIRTDITSAQSLNVRELKAGFYMIKVKDNNQIYTSRFVIQ